MEPGRSATEEARRLPPPAPVQPLLGILFMCLAGLLFPVMSGCAKGLVQEGYSSLQVSWARAFGHILFMLAAFLPRHGMALFVSRRPGLQLLRSGMLFSSNLCSFFALTFVPMADAAAISMTAPLIVALLAWPMLGERTTPERAAALLLGFAGVLTVIRPGSDVFHPASFAVLVSAASYALYQILTRRIAPIDPPHTSTVWSSVIGAFGMLLVLPFVWRTPATLGDILPFCAMGTLGALGHYCIARAMTYAPASLVSPFGYVQMLGSVLVGFWFFGHFPDAWTWAGAALIVAAGLWMGWTEARRPRA